MLSERSAGFAAIIGTCIVWGLSPIYYHAIEGTPALTILAHRTIWSLVIFALLLGPQGRLGQLTSALIGPEWSRIVLAALMISANWFIFIWSVLSGHAVEASLGYYMLPLVSVALGVVFLRETLSGLQWAAVGMAFVAVSVLSWGLGVPPWIALSIAGSFGVYGLIKKHVRLGPVLSVAAEVAVLAPLALIWLALTGTGQGFGTDWAQTGLLIGSGLITALPLVWFSYGAKRVGLATLGITMYLNPTLQFLAATLVLAEPFSRWHLIAFTLIWIALALYAVSLIRAAREAPANPASRSARVLVADAGAGIRGTATSRGCND